MTSIYNPNQVAANVAPESSHAIVHGDPSLNPSSPYHIHASETPSLVLVLKVLTGSNYHVWARSMRRALISKNKFKFLDGTITKLDPFDPMYEAWERCNTTVHLWLMHLISPVMARSVDSIKDAAIVWKDLKERFSQGDFLRLSKLQQELYTFK